MAKEFIVAIELGSTNITGIAGKKNSDGSIHVLAVVREDATSCIRKGVVYNIDKTTQCLTAVMKKLKTALKSGIEHVYVGVGGQSIHSVLNVIVKELPDDTLISQDIINGMMDQNRSMSYPDQEILDAATQEYKVGAQYTIEPSGVQSNRLEGNFLNILCRKSFYRNLNLCFENAGISIAELYLAPVALADSVLTDSEKRTGCMLVDLGADTTTVAVYYRNILRQLTVIPLGGNSITKDLTSFQMEEDEAEKLKLNLASAYTDNNEIDREKVIKIENGEVRQEEFLFCVEARLREIIENAWNQVPDEYKNHLMGGIVLTGGGANMKNIKRAFTEHTGIKKIRVATSVKQKITTEKSDIELKDCFMNTALGLLAKGDMNCATPVKPVNNGGLFEQTINPQTNETKQPVNVGNRQPGTVLKPEEREKIERERRIAAAEEDALNDRIKEQLEKNKNKPPKRPGFLNRWKDAIGDFANKIISAEEDEEK